MLAGMAHPLDGIRFKIDRAKKQIYEFNREIVSGAINVSGKDLRATYEFTANTTTAVPVSDLIFSIQGDAPPVPFIFSILAAECCHHLRSALDHLVYQLVIEQTKKPPTFNSAFPIVGKGKKVKKAWRNPVQEYEAQTSRLVQDLSPNAAGLIEHFQPLKRGATYHEDPLWILNELNNTDKHRIILLAVHKVSTYSITVTSRGKAVTARFSPGIRYERGAEIGRMPFHDPPFDNAQVSAEGDLVLEIAFNDVCGQGQVSVIPLLTQLAGYVSGVVETFATEFKG
jgi:hypothetical protein